MHTRQSRLSIALVILLAVTLAGGWPVTGAFTPAAQAEEDGKKFKLDHFACYEVEVERDRHDKDSKDKDKWDDIEVILFNQFGVTKVEVGKLKLLCVPTHKEHKDHKDDRH